ncbi:hypothetical protein BH10PSE7_BH10PSE7_15220 [soil metagenome]
MSAPSLFSARALPKLGILDRPAVKARHEIIDIAAIVIETRERAVLIDHGGKARVWLPLSQVEVSPNGDGRTVTVSLPAWLAEEKGIA